MIVHVDLEFIIIQMKQFMKVIGLMIHKKILVLKFGKIIQFIKVNIKMEKNLVLEFIFGPMVQNMKENGLIII